MKKLISLLKKIDDNLLKYLIYVYIFFMPLFPKIPLKGIDYTYIKIRPDDFFAALIIFVFFIYVIRKKIILNKKMFLIFSLFWVLVFISFLIGHYLLKTIQVWHIGFLHSARRIEYMIMFFVGMSVIKKKSDLFSLLKVVLVSLFLVCVYGIGQKFLGWPAVQTMNPEYSLGHLLILTPEARISSTFAGHYDLAAYLILLLPVIYGFFFYRKKTIYFLFFILALFVMILTASRASLIAYLISLSAFLIFIKKYWHLVFVLILTVAFIFTNNNLTSRIKRTFQIKRIFVNEQTGQVVIPQRSTSKELPAGSFYIQIKGKKAGQTQIITDLALIKEKIISDLRWEASQSGRILSKNEEALLFATISAGLKPINTVVSDISAATRLQVEWPRAIMAFLKNPLFGTGPSSITEATDNDFLRWLGELGLLGTSVFLYILYLIISLTWTSLKTMAKSEKYVYLGYLFGFFGLLINACWIDVFEASKVAYMFWLVSGFIFQSLTLKYEKG